MVGKGRGPSLHSKARIGRYFHANEQQIGDHNRQTLKNYLRAIDADESETDDVLSAVSELTSLRGVNVRDDDVQFVIDRNVVKSSPAEPTRRVRKVSLADIGDAVKGACVDLVGEECQVGSDTRKSIQRGLKARGIGADDSMYHPFVREVVNVAAQTGNTKRIPEESARVVSKIYSPTHAID